MCSHTFFFCKSVSDTIETGAKKKALGLGLLLLVWRSYQCCPLWRHRRIESVGVFQAGKKNNKKTQTVMCFLKKIEFLFFFLWEKSGKCKFCTICEPGADGIITESRIMLQRRNIWPDHRLFLVSVGSDCLCCCSSKRLRPWLFWVSLSFWVSRRVLGYRLPDRGAPLLHPECFLSLCLRGAEELYQLGKKPGQWQPDKPQGVLTIAPSLFVKHYDTVRARACFSQWRARAVSLGASTVEARWLRGDLI